MFTINYIFIGSAKKLQYYRIWTTPEENDSLMLANPTTFDDEKQVVFRQQTCLENRLVLMGL